MEKHLHNVGDLSPSARAVVESLTGRTLDDAQQVYIVPLGAPREPTNAERREAWQAFTEIVGEIHNHVRRSGVSSQKLEQTIREVCDEVRYSK